MNQDLKENLLRIDSLKRLALMLVFGLIYTIAELLVYAIAIFQIVYLLIKGELQSEVRNFAKSLSKYIYEIVQFLTFDSETLPFPFKAWDAQEQEDIVKKPSRKKVIKDDDEDEMHA